jgi:hypothetical protein
MTTNFHTQSRLGQRGRSNRGRSPRLDLVGLAEAAALLGISRSALCQRRLTEARRGEAGVPVPVAELSCGPIWRRTQILAYQELRELGPEYVAEQEAAWARRLEHVLATMGDEREPRSAP